MPTNHRRRRHSRVSWIPALAALGGLIVLGACVAARQQPVEPSADRAAAAGQTPGPRPGSNPETPDSAMPPTGQHQPIRPVPSPRLLYREEDLVRTVQSLSKSDLVELASRAKSDLAELRKTQTRGGFATRNRLIDLALTVALLDRIPNEQRPAGTDTLARSTVAATLALLPEMREDDKPNPVNRGSLTVGLAVAYDLLHPHLTTAQRRELAALLIEQALVVTLDGMHRPKDSGKFQWWVPASSNWTTLILGGAVLSALALRPEDAPAQVTASDGGDGTSAQSYDKIRALVLAEALPWLERAFLPILRNGGGTNEGNGYHHDMVLPLAMTLEAVRAAPPGTIPSAVAEPFITQGMAAMAVQYQGFLHLATPLPGVDFDYGDGVWNLTDTPTAFLVADLARQAGAPGWRAAAWQADRRCAKAGGTRAVYRARFAWERTAAEDPRGMGGFDPAGIPTSTYLFAKTITTPPPGSLATPEVQARFEPGVNEHQVVWRRSFTDPLAPALMLKGGDNRFDRHGALDAGTFAYVGQGVFWNRRPGWIGNYVLCWKDDKVDWSKRPFPCTFYHEYAKRAAGQNTLVVNPLANAYHDKAIPEPQTWLWQINPDQALGEDGLSVPVSPVTDIATPPNGPWTATVRYAPAYARHGVRDDPRTGRTFHFDPASGVVEITDRLAFARATGNTVQWGMFLSPGVQTVAVTPRRVLLTAQNLDGTQVHLAVERVDAGPGTFRVGTAEETLPQGTPPPEFLWRYANAKNHRKQNKLVLDLTDLAGEARWTIRLRPLPEAAGKSAAQVLGELP